MYLWRLLLAIWIFGLLGVAAELALLGHYEDLQQLLPFIVIALALCVTTWYVLKPNSASRRTFRALLLLFAVTGFVGLFLHYRGNVEFERERDPSLGGVPLIWEALTGATPALAPGTMLLFAFIGYALLVSRTTVRT